MFTHFDESTKHACNVVVPEITSVLPIKNTLVPRPFTWVKFI